VSRRTFHRAILGAGLGGTSAFVLAGTWFLVSRVWAESFTRTLEVLVVTPFMALWVLSPVLWAARPRSAPEPDEPEDPLAFWSDVLMIGVGTCIYLWQFVALPVFFRLALGTGSLWLILVVPAVQWGILGVAGALGRVRGTDRHR
jgi:hypothetical protein